jgi:hypothetical protein
MEMKELFKDFNLISNTSMPILCGSIPDLIFDELQQFVDDAKKIKQHPLAFLKRHHNLGKNSFQTSVNPILIEQSFLFPYLIKLGEYYLSIREIYTTPQDRAVRLRSHTNHYDKYDFWINFTNHGDENPMHTHAGSMSGVIYFSNLDELPTIFEDGTKFFGKPKDIIIFPAQLGHMVTRHTSFTERITFSFNLEYINIHD